MTQIDYNNRFFRPASNTENGEVDAGTIFHYRQADHALWATYQGGKIRFGSLVGKVHTDGALDFRYQHINDNGESMFGVCHSEPEQLPDGRIRLHEKWQWLSGDGSKGESIIEEVIYPAPSNGAAATGIMVATLELSILPHELAICTLAPDAPLPDWAAQASFFALTRTGHELSIVCPVHCVPPDVTAETSWIAFEFAGPLDFSLTGILAAAANPLAAAGISIFAISTYRTDYLLVRSSRRDEAIAVLRHAGHTVHLPTRPE